jgi:preflagellin peptidase FlaK
METELEILRIVLGLFFLAVSSWHDLKTREVPNRVWLIFAPVGFALLLLQSKINQHDGETVIPSAWLISIAVTAGISLSLFYLGLFGGADAKALICLSITMPTYPKVARYQPPIPTYPFPLAVLSNAVLTSSLLIIIIVGHNILILFRNGERMFDGMENEPLWSKILAFATGIKVDTEKLRAGSHYILLEHFTKGEDGKIIRHLKISSSLRGETKEEIEQREELLEEIDGKVWATLGLPFLVFITASYLFALYFGDFVTWFIFSFTPS